MKVYSYYFKSDSCDELLVTSTTEYKSALEFMKAEFEDEYIAWKQEGYEDDEIPWGTFMTDSIEV